MFRRRYDENIGQLALIAAGVIIALALLIFLTSCATPGTGGASSAVKIIIDTSEITGVHVRAMLPLGDEALDAGGMDTIASMVAQIPGVTKVEIVDYYQTQAAADEANAEASSVKEVFIGFSCGANAAPVVSAGVNRAVAGVFVIQASEWCGGGPLTPNVMHAQETYNPACPETLGLGCKLLDMASGFNAANFTVIDRPDCHTCSDHDPDAQNDIVLAVKAVANQASGRRMGAVLSGARSGSINVLVRYHGQSIY